jgi:hypothetical protein
LVPGEPRRPHPRRMPRAASIDPPGPCWPRYLKPGSLDLPYDAVSRSSDPRVDNSPDVPKKSAVRPIKFRC